MALNRAIPSYITLVSYYMKESACLRSLSETEQSTRILSSEEEITKTLPEQDAVEFRSLSIFSNCLRWGSIVTLVVRQRKWVKKAWGCNFVLEEICGF